MSGSVSIHISDEACAATIAQGCEMMGVTVNDTAPLLITDDNTHLTPDKQIIFLGGSTTAEIATHFSLPFSLSALLQRVEQLSMQLNHTVSYGDILLDMKQRHVTKGQKSEALTDKEARLLSMLIESADEGITKDTLLHDVWGYQSDLDTHTLETHIYRLRGKCSAIGSTLSIDAKDGGYCLTCV